jgi:hypothetical protein
MIFKVIQTMFKVLQTVLKVLQMIVKVLQIDVKAAQKSSSLTITLMSSTHLSKNVLGGMS